MSDNKLNRMTFLLLFIFRVWMIWLTVVFLHVSSIPSSLSLSPQRSCSMIGMHEPITAPLCNLMHSYAILCYLMHSYAILCYLMHSYAILCYLMLSYALLCYLMHSYAILCYLMHSYALLCYRMHYYAILCTLMHSVSVDFIDSGLLTLPMLRLLSPKAQGCKDLWKNI